MSAPLNIPLPQPTAQASGWRTRLAYLGYRVRQSPLTIAGLCMTLLVLLCMAFAPWLSSHDPNALNLAQRLAAPLSLIHISEPTRPY